MRAFAERATLCAAVCAWGACTTEPTVSHGEDAGAAGARDDRDGGHAGGSDLPCDLRALLEARCWQCHGDLPQFGAPMPLVTQADLRAPSKTDTERPVYELVQARVTDTRRPMPSPPAEPLSATELAIIDSWVRAGTPAAPEGERCEDGTRPDDAGAPGASPVLDPSLCDATQRFLAHQESTPGDTTPFQVPNSGDHYHCFAFKTPWTEPVHALQLAPVIDDARVVHHWLLYEQEGGAEDGASFSCFGVHQNARLIAAWAPGNQTLTMPEGVGMALSGSADTYYVLELHYNNAAGVDARDRSGVEVCATTKLRSQNAAVHWLGTERIVLTGGGEETLSSTCRPEGDEPITLLSVFPHMHTLGVRMRLDLTRAAGGTEPLFDQPFSFEEQRNYPLRAVMQPGDALTTSCTWNNTTGGVVRFGPNTSDEMCYAFVLAYPAGSLSGGAAATTAENTCVNDR